MRHCPANTITTEQMLPVESLKVGEYVRRKPDSRKTYQRGDFDRVTKRYSLNDVDDISHEIFVKRGTMLFVGFDY